MPLFEYTAGPHYFTKFTFRVLCKAASQQPVPDDGKKTTFPVSVFKSFFKSCVIGWIRSGIVGFLWSSIGQCIACWTAAGTLDGPGTNKKWCPDIWFFPK